MLTSIKIKAKKAIRKTWSKMPRIVLALLVIYFTVQGVCSTANTISSYYEDKVIAPLVYDQKLNQ